MNGNHRTFKAQPLSGFFVPLAVVALAACSSGDPAGPGEDPSGATDDHGEGTGQIAEGFSGGTVADAAASTCGTASVKGLSFQIIEEGNCIEPGAFSPLTLPANATAGSGVFLFIQKPARDKLQSIVKANPGKGLTINSMLRTAAQQYLLFNWYQTGRCGISLAAKPGNSNHESGLAIDVQEYSSWRTIFEGNGFRWLGASDPWHYDWVGAGAKDHRGLDVLAFQRLWNRNNPNDKIAEDGSWGPATESRMRKSPAGGFAVGAVCHAAPPEPTCQAVFSDICGSAHQPAIEWMAKEGLSSGCGGGKFCPDETVSRAQMAAFLTAALDLPPGPDAFTDDEGSIHEGAINAVAAAGITTGCGGTNYCPDAQVTREQMATFLVRAFKLAASGEDLFTDDEASIHEADINALGAAGVTSGCGGTNYCPASPVTRGQMATFLHRAMQ